MDIRNIKVEDSGAYLPFYFEWIDIIGDLPKEDLGILLTAFIEYARGREITVEIPAAARHAYLFITSAIRRAEINRANGRKGGQAKAEKLRQNSTKSDFAGTPRMSEPTKAEEKEENQNPSPTQEVKEETCEIECSKNAENYCERTEIASEQAQNTVNDTCGGSEKKAEKNASPVSREEVRQFFAAKGFTSLPDEFYSHYAAVDWKRGDTQITDWRAAAESWELRYRRANPQAQSYPSRPHEGVQSTYPQRQPSNQRKERYGTFDAEQAFFLNVNRTMQEGKELDDEYFL